MEGNNLLRAVGATVNGVPRTVSSSSSSSFVARASRTVSMASITAVSKECRAERETKSRSSLPCEGEMWESVVEEDGFRLADRYAFQKAPSVEEVTEAVSAIQQVLVPVTFSQVVGDEHCATVGKEAVGNLSFWTESALQLYNTANAQSKKVMDAFCLLQINPSIQRMVVSLSSDNAVWDAVMRNEAVKELRESFYAGESSLGMKLLQCNDDVDIPTRILRWILENVKMKVMEFFEKIEGIVMELFHPQKQGNKVNAFADAVSSSFMLSVVVFIVVFIFRVQRS